MPLIEVNNCSVWMLENVLLHIQALGAVGSDASADDAIKFLYEIADEKNKER